MISKTSYIGVTYTHQGSVLDAEWQEYLVMDDEYDEEENLDSNNPALDLFPVTYIWDIRNLEKPVNVCFPGLQTPTRNSHSMNPHPNPNHH